MGSVSGPAPPRNSSGLGRNITQLPSSQLPHDSVTAALMVATWSAPNHTPGEFIVCLVRDLHALLEVKVKPQGRETGNPVIPPCRLGQLLGGWSRRETAGHPGPETWERGRFHQGPELPIPFPW